MSEMSLSNTELSSETSELCLNGEAIAPPRRRPLHDLLIKVINQLGQNSELRDQMRGEPRWERFFTEARQPTTNRDTNEIGHALNTIQIARYVTSPCRRRADLRAEDAAAIRIAALIHDLGELGARDLTYDHKNDAHETAELQFFDRHCGAFFPSMDRAELLQIKEIFHTIAHPQDTEDPRARCFSMIERLGYLSTALELFVERPGELDWQSVCANVCKNQGRHLLYLVDEFPAAKAFLAEREYGLTEMLKYLRKHQEQLSDYVDFTNWDAIVAQLSNL